MPKEYAKIYYCPKVWSTLSIFDITMSFCWLCKIMLLKILILISKLSLLHIYLFLFIYLFIYLFFNKELIGALNFCVPKIMLIVCVYEVLFLEHKNLKHPSIPYIYI